MTSRVQTTKYAAAAGIVLGRSRLAQLLSDVTPEVSDENMVELLLKRLHDSFRKVPLPTLRTGEFSRQLVDNLLTSVDSPQLIKSSRMLQIVQNP